MSDNCLAIGIDLGTTNSCVGVYRGNGVEIIHNDCGLNITPSIVAFTDTERIIGDKAKDKLAIDTENTVFGVKRMIGRQYDDPDIQTDLRHWPFNVQNVNGKPMVKVKWLGKDKTLHPEEISAMVLTKMKEIAEEHLGHPVKDAVITVPAYFDNNQRQATRAAGLIAGLNVLRLINEPTAAAIAYGLDKKLENHRNVLVYDLGGGTFDVSILTMDKGVFEVKATKGDTHLGGEDFDIRMVEYFAEDIKKKFKKDVFEKKHAVRRLRTACEKAKVQLSNSNRVLFGELANLLEGVDYEPTITRIEFERMNKELFEKTIRTVEEALKDCNMSKGDIHDVVLVGGSTRIPKVQILLREFFKRDKLSKNINPDEAVAYGAAIQAAILSGNRPDNLQGIELYDVVPLSLGTDMIGGLMSVIIPKNTPIPTRKKQTYTTTRDDQTEMLVQVYEGERTFIKDNSFLGQTTLTGLKADSRGYAKVDVIFEIDDDCILHVKVRERDTGIEQNMQIMNHCKRISDRQMGVLIQEAELYRLSDMMGALRIRALNDLEFYMHDLKSSCGRSEIGLTASQKSLVMSKINSIRDWLDSDNAKVAKESDYVAKQKELEAVWNPIITYCMQMTGKAPSTNKPVIHLGD